MSPFPNIEKARNAHIQIQYTVCGPVAPNHITQAWVSGESELICREQFLCQLDLTEDLKATQSDAEDTILKWTLAPLTPPVAA